jgi:hypothetical protein
MVDLAIAANFVRELTEDQFAEKQRIRRRNVAAQRTANGSGDTLRASGRTEKTRAGRTEKTRIGRTEKTRIGRTIARLAQVRG